MLRSWWVLFCLLLMLPFHISDSYLWLSKKRICIAILVLPFYISILHISSYEYFGFLPASLTSILCSSSSTFYISLDSLALPPRSSSLALDIILNSLILYLSVLLLGVSQLFGLFASKRFSGYLPSSVFRVLYYLDLSPGKLDWFDARGQFSRLAPLMITLSLSFSSLSLYVFYLGFILL